VQKFVVDLNTASDRKGKGIVELEISMKIESFSVKKQAIPTYNKWYLIVYSKYLVVYSSP
jgi:hypothetical protein